MSDTNRRRVTMAIATLAAIALFVVALWIGRRNSRAEVDVGPVVTRATPIIDPDVGTDSEGASERAAIVAAIQATKPAPTEDPAKRIATIFGRVVDHRTEAPIANARVTCSARFGVQPGSDVLAVSRDDGRFRFETACDIPRTLRVEADGFATALIDRLPLPSERGYERVELGDIRMHRGVRPIVRVLDTHETPCKAADLFLIQGTESVGGLYANRFVGTTDERGEWRAVEPIALEAEGLLFIALTNEGLGWALIDVVADGTNGQVLEVRLHDSGDITVHVQDESGAALANVEMQVAPRSYPIGPIRPFGSTIGAKERWPFLARLSAITDEHGDARVRGLPNDGAMLWNASAQSHAAGWARSELNNIHVGGSEPHVVVMKRAQLVHTIVGKVLDRNGRPIAASVVTCDKVTTTPDLETGAYRLEIPASVAKQVNVQARADGYRLSFAPRVGEPRDPLVVDFVLEKSGVIAGVVEDPDGHPLAGVQLYLSTGNGSTRSKDDGSFAFLDAIGQDFELSVFGLARDDVIWAPTRMAVKLGDRNVRVVLHPGLDLPSGTLRARVVECVTRAPVPVLSAHVVPEIAFASTTGVDSRRSVRDIGELRVRGLADCRWRAWILSTEGRTASVEFTISPNERDVDIEIQVSPLRAIRGRVRLDGKPLIGASKEKPVAVWAVIAGDWQPPPDLMIWSSAKLAARRDTQLAEDGTFRIEGLVPAEYVVMVRGAGVERSVKVTLSANEDADVTIDAKHLETPAEITLHGLDRGFDDFLFVRVDDGSPSPEEFDVETHNRTEMKFQVAPGHMDLFVFPSKGKNQPTPPPGTQWIKKATLDLAPGEKRTVEIFPR